MTDAKTLKEIQDTDAEIELLKKKIKDIADLALARDVATKALAVAQGEIKASGAKMNAGCFNAAQKMGKDAAVLVDTATKVSDYTAAVVKIADIKPFLVKAETYLTDMQQWRFDAEMYLVGCPRPRPPKPRRRPR